MQETMNGGLTLKINKRDRHGVVNLWVPRSQSMAQAALPQVS
jgi:hypothetical protein